MFLPFLVGYGLAIRQCRAELMATQSWLQDEVAALRKEAPRLPALSCTACVLSTAPPRRNAIPMRL
jgi:hypothetical protein